MKKLILFCLLACSPLLAQTHKFCSTDANCTWTGNQTFSGSLAATGSLSAGAASVSSLTASGTATFNAGVTINSTLNLSGNFTAGTTTLTTAGIFDNSNNSFGIQSNVNSCSPATMFLNSQGAGKFGADAATGCVHAGATATEYQADGITGYALNDSATTKAVGVYSYAQCNANNSLCWGANPSVNAAGGATGTTIQGIEVDVDVQTGATGTTMRGVQVSGPVVNAAPALAQAFSAGTMGGTAGAVWTEGFVTQTGCCNVAFFAAPAASGNSQSSQPMVFSSTSSGGANLQASISSDNTGSFIVTPVNNFLLNHGAYALPGNALIAADGANSGGIRLIASGTNQSIALTPSGSGSVTASGRNVTTTVASGTATMTTAAIAAGACGTTVTVTATGAATTDTISWSFNAAIGANPGVLTVQQWPTSGNVNFEYCNPTAASVTPSAATLNWKVLR